MTASIAMVSLALASAGLQAPQAQGQTLTDQAAMNWSPCASVVETTPDDATAMECATLRVPLDYTKPAGRTIRIEVSRMKATKQAERQGVLLFNPGGPGVSGIDYLPRLAKSQLGTLRTDHDLVSFDPRGTGRSDRVDCSPSGSGHPPAGASEKEQARFYSEHEARENKRCVAQDHAFAAQLTAANIARDMDVIRRVLGERKIDYFGISWGTGLGAVYRSMFDGHVRRMWLDSVMPPHMNLEAMDGAYLRAQETRFSKFATWIARQNSKYHFGPTRTVVSKSLFKLREQLTRNPRATSAGGGAETVVDGSTVTNLMLSTRDQWAWAASNLVIVRDGGAPERTQEPAGPQINHLAYRALVCNDGSGGRDFEVTWRNEQRRQHDYQAAGGDSVFAWQCSRWPLPARPWKLRKGTSLLQLSGHIGEEVTPYSWARATKNVIGGSLMTVDNDLHGTLWTTPCGMSAVQFFRTGAAPKGKCPGHRAAQ
ncbi:alpha/beta fold hydrolase [Streptomyces lydicus]|uniref:alpha/beta fold hydrolase n=1 Tax=Streptomyces lydicus TaxID=47763 RepID=UPI0036E2E90E